MPGRLVGSVVVLADLGTLRLCWPEPTALAAHLSHPSVWVATDGADAAAGDLARTGLWLGAAWLALALVTVLTSTLPGLVGRVGDAVAERTVPAIVRRGVVATIGASVVLTPLAAGASPADGRAGPPAVVSSTTSPVATALSDGWPWPATHISTKTDNPGAPVPWPHSATPPDSADVVVRMGDCLWAIAANRLGPHASRHDIAVESRRWYDANAVAIGGDPSLIHPGQHLHHPTEKGPRS